MRHVTLGAALSGVVFLYLDLLEPLRTGRTGFVASNTVAESQLLQLDVGIINMRLGDTMARFA